MKHRAGAILCAVAALAAPVVAQDATLEYRVKAAYLLNFTRFVEWPAPATPRAPIEICVAEVNPFGPALAATLAGETASGRPLTHRIVRGTDIASCAVLFVPGTVAADPYIRAAGTSPILTVGESPGFLRRGGMINFVIDGRRVRFTIRPEPAGRSGLVISSRLLQLATLPPAGDGGT